MLPKYVTDSLPPVFGLSILVIYNKLFIVLHEEKIDFSKTFKLNLRLYAKYLSWNMYLDIYTDFCFGFINI